MICAVIVTYNRKELLLRCIRALQKQTLRPDILIYDNHSTDGTREYLISEGVLDERGFEGRQHVIYHYAAVNSGGAGGFSNGLKMAISYDYDAYMLMDDDGYPIDENCVERLWQELRRENEKPVILNPLVVSSNQKGIKDTEIPFGSEVREGWLSFALEGKESVEEYLAGTDIAPFNGTFLSREVVRCIGVPKAELFIYGDEFEYITRARSRGIKTRTCREALYYHPYAPVQKRRILGREIIYRELKDLDRMYYFVRNYEYVIMTYYGKKKALLHALKVMCKCLLYREGKIKKMKVTLRALIDGYRM